MRPRTRSLVKRLAILLPACLLVWAPPTPAPWVENAQAAGPQTLDEYFAASAVSVDKKKTVTLTYDFRSKKQLADFEMKVPFPIKAVKKQKIGWYDGKLEVVGSTGARHKAVWDREVSVKATYTPDTDKDLGGFIVPVPSSNDFASFTLVETNFHKWDNNPGGQHSILKFGDQWRETGPEGDFIGFRYVARRPPKGGGLVVGRGVDMTFRARKNLLYLAVPEFEIKGKDPSPGKQRLRKFQVGFYVIKGRMLVDNVTISGRLSSGWLKENKIALKTTATSASAELDNETRALIEAYRAAKKIRSPGSKLVKLVADPEAAKPSRDAAAQALSTGPKKAVKLVSDLLYSEDVETRAYGIQIVKALLGKDYGFKPKGSEKRRSAATKKMFADWEKNPGQLEG